MIIPIIKNIVDIMIDLAYNIINNSQELLAVGKLSKDIQKSYGVETLIKVKLDY